MKVLVTGARGFIGSALVRHLRFHAVDVTCLSRGSPSHSDLADLKWARLDTSSQASWDAAVSPGYDVIYHLGWSSIPSIAEADPAIDLIDNVGAGLRLLDAIRRLSPRSRLIFSSSGGTIYGRVEGGLATESDAPRPISAYGVAKLAFESYLDMMRREKGLDLVSARISNPYGPSQYSHKTFGAVSTFVRKSVNRETISIFGSDQIVRDYIHVVDLANALFELGNVAVAPGIVNIGSGEGVSLRDIIRLIEDGLGRRVATDVGSARPFDVARIVLDISLIKSTTSWEPRISLKEGISALLEHERGLPGSRID